MPRTIYFTASSLDGFIADANNNLDWLLQFEGDDEGAYDGLIENTGAVVMGSTTYEWLLDNHIHPDSDSPNPWPYEQPTWVFTSRKLNGIPGADIRFAGGDVRPVYDKILQVVGDKNIWMVGGGELAGAFHDEGLLDELIISVAPVTLGGGAPLLPRRIAGPHLKLISAKSWGEGFVTIHYEVPKPKAGRPESRAT
ncbi:MAG: dihydrofolate reductase [Bacteroidetes bacterium]|nr:dihydrofolate reductase [Bacteroidota bacterium]